MAEAISGHSSASAEKLAKEIKNPEPQSEAELMAEMKAAIGREGADEAEPGVEKPPATKIVDVGAVRGEVKEVEIKKQRRQPHVKDE